MNFQGALTCSTLHLSLSLLQIRQFRPQQVLGPLTHERVVSVSAGPHYSLAVTALGHVFAWGLVYYSGPAPWSGSEAQLYEPGEAQEASRKVHREQVDAAREVASEPRRVGGELGEAHVVEVSAGAEHWLALTKEGKVYSSRWVIWKRAFAAWQAVPLVS